MSKLSKKIRAFRARHQLDRDLDDELRFHMEMKAAALANPVGAQRRFGNTTRLKEACRDLWAFSRAESWWQDVRYAVRMLAKTPGFTLIAVIALALGIGADTGIFTIANGAFSWNMGLDHIDRIVHVTMTNAERSSDFGVSYPDFRDLRSQTKSLAGLAAYQMFPVNLSDKRTLPDRYWCVKMSANGFAVSEQKPLLGRTFTNDDEQRGAAPVVELTYHVWQDRYGKDRNIVNRTIRVDDVPTTVIGVMPPGKRFPEETDLWMPLIPTAQMERRSARSVTLFGRTANGVSTAAARTELSAIADRLAKENPETNKGLTAGVQTIAELTGVYNARPLFVALWFAVGFVLLIACADVANMLLARGAGRFREISIRVAIGAGRARIIRQLLIESVLLAMAGGFVGWLVALAYLRGFDAATSSIAKPVWLVLSMDKTAFAYLAVISIVTGILFGLAPAIRLARVDVHNAIKDGGQGIARGPSLVSASNLLVMLEMALCVVLLTGAGLMIHSTVNLYDAPLGASTSNVLTAHVNLPEAKYPLTQDEVRFHRTLQHSMNGLPGVAGTGIVSHLPFGGWLTFPYDFEGVAPDPDLSPNLAAVVASPGYFDVLRVRPRRGRTFTETDASTGVPVVVVNETLANSLWPHKNPLGKRIRLLIDRVPQPWLIVVGVIPDILQDFRHPLEHEPIIYLPYAQHPERQVFLLSLTRVPPRTLAEALRREVQRLDPNLAVYDIQTLEGRIAEHRVSTAILAEMFSVFAAIALVLACVGMYAVIAHSVSQRTQEIGIRMAVGGSRRDIVRLVYSQAMQPLFVGMALGLPVALILARVLQTVLVGVSPNDPFALILGFLALFAAGVAGCAIPAWRAVRVDPIVALRYE
ncbi:MAG: ABC transporter permease [Acidobacteriaceae bacterium]|nr:ABC transporter permease [Acidobacteriaceae bacterium]